MTSLSITTCRFPMASGRQSRRLFCPEARRLPGMIESISKKLGVNLFDHIVEVEVETPMTIAHYTSDYRGGIYGYSHSMDDHIVARCR
jgi:hypothetical protein